jgi:hypothetical protein
VRSRVRTRTHGSVGRRGNRPSDPILNGLKGVGRTARHGAKGLVGGWRGRGEGAAATVLVLVLVLVLVFHCKTTI